MIRHGMPRDEFHAMQAKAMTEAELQAVVLAAAKRLGWLAYHTHDSRRSQPGFPDLVLVRREVILYRELKTMRGRLTPDQQVWIRALADAGVDAAVWRPSDWYDDTIATALAGGRP